MRVVLEAPTARAKKNKTPAQIRAKRDSDGDGLKRKSVKQRLADTKTSRTIRVSISKGRSEVIFFHCFESKFSCLPSILSAILLLAKLRFAKTSRSRGASLKAFSK